MEEKELEPIYIQLNDPYALYCLTMSYAASSFLRFGTIGGMRFLLHALDPKTWR